MPSAEVSKEHVETIGTKKVYKREKQRPGLSGVQAGDRFVAESRDALHRRHFQRIKEQAGDTPKKAAENAKKLADQLASNLNAQFTLGISEDRTVRTWEEFRERLNKVYLDPMKPRSLRVAKECLAHFERIVRPNVMAGITAETIADFITTRRKENGKKKREKVSTASINKELRHIRAVLNRAKT